METVSYYIYLFIYRKIYLHIRILLEVVYLAIHIYFQLYNCSLSFKIIPKIRIFFVKFPYKVYITSIYLLVWVSIRVYLSIFLSTYVPISLLIHLCIYNIFLWYLSISLFSIIRISLPILTSLLYCRSLNCQLEFSMV